MIYSFLYVLTYSCAAIFIERLYFTISPFFSLLVTASIAIIFFNLLNIRSLKSIYRACWKEKKLWFSVMATILVMWVCTMIGPGLIGAALCNFLTSSFLGVLGLFSLVKKDFKNNRLKFYIGLCIVGLMIVMVANKLEHAFTIHVLVGILAGFIVGGSGFIYFKQSQLITKRIQLASTQILAVRFYLTVIVMFAVLPHGSFALYATPINLGHLVLLAFLSLIIPLFFQQKALERISSAQNAIIASLCPACIALLQEVIFRNTDLKYIIVYLIYSLLIALPYLVNKVKQRVALAAT